MTGPYVNIDQLAKHFAVSVSTVRTWVRRGDIPTTCYIKVGSTYRFNLGDVESHLKGEAEQTAAQPESTVVEVTQVSALAELEEDWAEDSDEDLDLSLDLDEDY